MSMTPLDTLIREYEEWNAAQGLNLGSADEHLFDDDLTHEERKWLGDFCRRWEAAAKQEREEFSK
jgi:hypothetical protein